MNKLAIVLLSMCLAGCAPSCERLGGTLVQDGFIYVWQWIDAQKGIGYLQPYPNMICKIGEAK